MPQAKNKLSVPVKCYNFTECKLNVTVMTGETSEDKLGESTRTVVASGCLGKQNCNYRFLLNQITWL